MAAQTILIIRHGEKPEPGGDNGVDSTGAADPKSLTPRGWQRAGAWAELFVPALGQTAALPVPAALFASAPASHADIKAGAGGSKSRRPLETITPLAAKLDQQVDLGFSKGDESGLAAALVASAGVVLVCWQHEDIIAIVNAVAPGAAGVPAAWPGTCFNVVFRLDRPDPATPWVFSQIAPTLLDGDQAAGI
jgi:hypothetical protein